MNKSILIIPVVAILLGAIPSAMAYTAYSFTDGYNKGRSDTLNNRSFSDLCSLAS
jgi:hypothetical protein